jgi:hypothetical protein
MPREDGTYDEPRLVTPGELRDWRERSGRERAELHAVAKESARIFGLVGVSSVGDLAHAHADAKRLAKKSGVMAHAGKHFDNSYPERAIAASLGLESEGDIHRARDLAKARARARFGNPARDESDRYLSRTLTPAEARIAADVRDAVSRPKVGS